MDKQWRSSGLFVAGALAGTAVVLTAYLGWFRQAPPAAPPVRAFATAAAPAPAVETPAVPQATALASSCPSQALVAASGDADGRFALQPVLGSGARAEPGAFLAVAREAADQGRARDAEVALLAACHVTEEGSGRQSAPLADVKSQLGQHYVLLASKEGSDQARDKLLERAAALFADSASAYAEALGRNASKTRLAEERLASVHDPETLRAALHQQQTAPETTTLGAARSATPEPTPAPAMVQTDPELAQLEYDLRRLHAQAAAVSRDPNGLRRRDAQAIAQRDARCRDKACMLQWYAQRRAQLLDEF
jgi:hypothetical protein